MSTFAAAEARRTTDRNADSAGTVAHVIGSTQWRIADGLSSELLDARGLRLDQWRREGRVEVVKDGPHRTVYRLSLETGAYFLKHFRTPDLRSKVLNVVRSCRAEMEWRAVHRVAEAGVPTFEPVAIGRSFHGPFVRDNYLVSREISETEPLDEFVARYSGPEQMPVRLRRSIACELGTLIGWLHRARLEHRDLHPGNVLIRVEGDAVRLWLIDLHAVGRVATFSRRRRRANLSLPGNFFLRLATPADRLVFFDAYRKSLGLRDGRRADDVRATEQLCQRELLRAYDRADRKWRRPNRRLVVEHVPGRTIRRLRTLDDALLTVLRNDPETLLAGRSHHAGRASSPSVSTSTVTVAVKYSDGLEARPTPLVPDPSATTDYRIKTSREVFGLVSNGRLRREWEQAHALLRRGVRTPKPLALVEPRRFRIGGRPSRRTYLVTEDIPESQTLVEFLKSTRRMSRDHVHSVLLDLARQLRRLHEFGLTHRRLCGNEILVSMKKSTPARRASEGGGCEATVLAGASGWSDAGITNAIDAPRVWLLSPQDVARRKRREDEWKSLAGLARELHASGLTSTSTSLRFLKHLSGGRLPSDWKSRWKRIAHAT